MSPSPGVPPWLTIVTVVRDAPRDFADTVASVASQDLAGVEYVVIDSSTDQGVIPDLLSGVAVEYQWVPASGIYSAMNTGLHVANGDYVLFLNAGDTLSDPSVFSEIKSILRLQAPVWLYAEVQMSDSLGKVVETPKWDYQTEQDLLFSRGHFPCHQGTFTRRDTLLELGGFDTSYEIVADYVAFLKLSKLAAPVHLPKTVAVFQPGGVSSDRWRAAIGEFHRARREVLAPSGFSAFRERLETAALLTKTAAYRGLWAPGRIGHPLVSRLRRGDKAT